MRCELEWGLMNKVGYLILNPRWKSMNSFNDVGNTYDSYTLVTKLTCEPTEFVGDNGDGVFPFGTSEKPLFDRYSVIIFWASLTSCLRILYNFKYVSDWHLKL